MYKTQRRSLGKNNGVNEQGLIAINTYIDKTKNYNNKSLLLLIELKRYVN